MEFPDENRKSNQRREKACHMIENAYYSSGNLFIKYIYIWKTFRFQASSIVRSANLYLHYFHTFAFKNVYVIVSASFMLVEQQALENTLKQCLCITYSPIVKMYLEVYEWRIFKYTCKI